MRTEFTIRLSIFLVIVVVGSARSQGTWITKSSVGFTAREWATCSNVHGKIYAIGGFDGHDILSTVEVYDPLTDSWAQPKTIGNPIGVIEHTSCVINDRIYVMGSPG